MLRLELVVPSSSPLMVAPLDLPVDLRYVGREPVPLFRPLAEAPGGVDGWTAVWDQVEAALQDGAVGLRGQTEGPLLVTAPHAVAHWRDGAAKLPETGTASVAAVLAALAQGGALYASGETAADANHELGVTSPLRQVLQHVLRPSHVVVDVHGMRDAWPMDINLGLGAAPCARTRALGDAFAEGVTSVGLRVVIGRPFTAAAAVTLTSFVQRRGVPAIQMEIARRWRVRGEATETSHRTSLVEGLWRSWQLWQLEAPARD